MNNDSIETINYKGFEIETFRDENASSPDEWANDDCFLIYDHRDFNVKMKGFDPDEIFEHIQATKKLFFEDYYVFPVYAYIHSGVSLSLSNSNYPFNDRWDVSFKGFALVKRQKGWTYQRKKAYKVAESVVSEWNQYLGGEVYGYTSNHGACWGFYGEEGYKEMIDNAKSEIDYHIKNTTQKQVSEHLSKLKEWIKAKVSMQYRSPLQINLI